MYKLARQVRFSINPFLPEDIEGANSFASRPTGEGLSIFFELFVEVTGTVEPATGFVVNVSDIDSNVRKFVVPIFAEQIRQHFRRAEHIGLSTLSEILQSAQDQLADKFGTARLSKLSLKLNPYRKITMETHNSGTVYFSEKFEFAATHKLWNTDFTDEQNFEIFGKCANPTGHGHNYVVEVTIKMPTAKDDFRIGDFEKAVDSELVQIIDHKNLNADVEQFNKTIPTVENIACFAWNRLVGKFGQAGLHCVTVWETDKTYCSYTAAAE
jgi:6-pyruvoyltetrahydropterin/6-carboxytetrahydropterin synthase